MKKVACILLISGMLTIFLGCPILPLDSLDNHADPQTESYQGYLAIYDPDEIALSLADDSILTEPTFVVSEVIDAESYHIQIARDEIFGTVLFENDLFASNLIEAAGLETSLPKSLDSCYWRARAKVNGVWGEWSDTGSFVYLHPNTLYFDSQGGSTPIPAYKTFVEGIEFGEFPIISNRNKIFEGWWSKPDGKGIHITADSIVPTGKGQIAYAKWSDYISNGWSYTRNTRDGLQDFAYGTSTNSNLEYTVRKNLGLATSMLTGDVDGDGYLEIAYTSGKTLKITSIDESETLTYVLLETSRIAMIEDFDGDTIPDIWVYSVDGSLRVRVYNGEGSLLKTFNGQHDGGSDVNMVPIGFTGDKVLIKYGAGYALSPRGMAAFDPETGNELWYYQVGPAPELSSVADIDGNGLLDISLDLISVNNGVAGNGTYDSNTYVIVVDETGSKKLSLATPSPSTGASRSVFVDLDDDGLSEIVCFKGHNQYYNGQSKILVYNRGGTIQDTFLGPNDSDWKFAVGDLDGDGSVEIVASSTRVSKTFIVSATMQKKQEVSASGWVQFIADLDGNG